MFESLTIANFRSIRRAQIPLRPLTAFVGKNASGKSWALRALARVEQSARGGAFTLRDADVPMTSSEAGEMALRLVLPRHEFVEKATYDAARRIEAARRLVDGADASSDANPLFPSLVAGRPQRFVSFDVATLRAPWPYGAAIMQLSDRGAGLPGVVQHLLNHHRTLLDDVEAAMRRQYPGFQSVSLHVDSGNFAQLRFRFEGASDAIDAADVSDGLLLSLAYQILCRDPDPPGLMLIEEPENGLDPARLGDVLAVLRMMSAGRFGAPAQVVIASHSPALLDYLSPDEVIWFHRAADGATSAVGLAAVEELDELREELSDGNVERRVVDGTARVAANASAQRAGGNGKRQATPKKASPASGGNGAGPGKKSRVKSGSASNSRATATRGKRAGSTAARSKRAASTAAKSKGAASNAAKAKAAAPKPAPTKRASTSKSVANGKSAAKSGAATKSTSSKNGAAARSTSPKAPAAAKPRAAAKSRSMAKSASAGKSASKAKRAPAKASAAKR